MKLVKVDLRQNKGRKSNYNVKEEVNVKVYLKIGNELYYVPHEAQLIIKSASTKQIVFH